MRVVVSLTTVPSRVSHINITLNSIQRQSYKPDDVYVCIPFKSQSESLDYKIPANLNDEFNIIRCQDYGPITKLVGVLPLETDPDTVIITVDDDVVYPEGMIEKMISKHREYTKCAIGSAGFKFGGFPFYYSSVNNRHENNNQVYSFNIPPEGEPVDVFFSSPGILYKREFFPSQDRLDKILRFTTENDDLQRNDTLTLCGYLSKRGIQRRVFKLPQITDTKTKQPGLSKNKINAFFSLLRAIRKAKQLEFFQEHAPFSRTKTMTYPAVIGTVIIIVLIALLSTKSSSV